MAMGEIGMFLPAESAYETPGAFSQALRAEATKRASYLSQMDQFYAQLEESKRQFEETLSFQKESWEQEFGLSQEQLEFNKRMGLGQLLLGLIQAKTQRQATRPIRQGHISLGGRDEKLDFLKDVYARENDENAAESGTGWLGPGFSYPSTGRAQMWD